MRKQQIINYQSLNKSINIDDISKFREENPTKKLFLSKKMMQKLILIDIGIFIISIIILFIINIGNNLSIGQIITYPFFMWPIIIGFIIFIFYKVQTSSWQKYIRLFLFAKDNNLTYVPSINKSDNQGMIFNIGRNRKANDLFISSSTNGTTYEFANYQYTVGSDDDEHTVFYGYIMIQLERNLPHIVLDSQSDNARIFGMNLSDLPVNFDKNQRLSLEGDFDKYFSLYAPEEYKRDALYIFSPDLMALFIDESSPFDAEIIDNKLYIYSNSVFNLQDQKTLERIFRIIYLVGGKTLSQTDKYADERVGNRLSNTIAEPGRRLKTKIPPIIKIFIIIFILMFVFQIISMFSIFNLK